MSEYIIMKAVEHGKLPAKFRKQYPTIKSLAHAGWWTQKKYDGCMGIATIRYAGGSTMQSRTGEDYTTACGSILEELREVADSLQYYWADFVVIGEVWQPIEEASFPVISGKFRSQRPARDLKFMVHDLLPTSMNTDKPYHQRFDELASMFPDVTYGDALCHVACTLPEESDPEYRALQWRGEGGYDGAILRDPNAGYTVGTVKKGEIVKVKPTLSLDLEILRTNVAVGEKTGRPVYTIVVSYQGVTSFVGSGVPHVLTWAAGDIVEIEALGVTADGKLREPRWKGLRFDKTQPD